MDYHKPQLAPAPVKEAPNYCITVLYNSVRHNARSYSEEEMRGSERTEFYATGDTAAIVYAKQKAGQYPYILKRT